MSRQLTAILTLYPVDEVGKPSAAVMGWGCPCCVSKSVPLVGYDGWPLLDQPLEPGNHREVGFVFLSGETAANIFRDAGKFYLWEGRFIGEAIVVK